MVFFTFTMFHFHLLTVLSLISLLVVEIPASLHEDPFQVKSIVNQNLRQPRSPQMSTVTSTQIQTTTVSSVTTQVVSTKRTCAVYISTGTVVVGGSTTTITDTPTVACRKKRMIPQIISLNPSGVISTETTLVPQFHRQNRMEIISGAPFTIESSMNDDLQNVRFYRPMMAAESISSLVSSLVERLMTKTITTTNFNTVFTSTETLTTFTTTVSFFVVGSCFPANVNRC